MMAIAWRPLQRALGVGLLALAALPAQGPEPVVIKAAEGQGCFEMARVDANRDGRPDLLLQTAVRAERFQRSVQLHLRQTEGTSFVTKPDRVWPLAAWDTAFFMVDRGAEEGPELLVLNRLGVFATGGGDATLKPLVPCEFLFQVPEPWRALPLQSLVKDLNGDGRDDLLLPEPGALLVVLQDAEPEEEGGRRGFSRRIRLVPPKSLEDLRQEQRTGGGLLRREGRRGVRVQFGALGGEGGPLVDFEDAMNVPAVADWNADGRLDLLLRSAAQLHVYEQGEDGQYPEAPTRSLPLPFVEDRGLMIDLSWSANAVELDGDGKVDCVLASRHVSGEGALVQVYGTAWSGPRAPTAEHPLFGPEGLPRQVLRVQGHAVGLSLEDLDGDGKKDLLLGSYTEASRGLFGRDEDKGFGLRVLLFLNQGGTFSARADGNFEQTIGLGSIGDLDRQLGLRAFKDLNGDGIRELLVRTEPGRFAILPSRRTGRTGFEYQTEPLFVLAVPSGGDPDLWIEDTATDLWVIEEGGVRCWSF